MRFKRTTLITVGCLAALAGVGLARLVYFEPSLWPFLLIAFYFFLPRSNRMVTLLLVIFLGLGLGLWRGSIYMQHLHKLQALSGQKVSVEVTALTDSVYSTNSQVEFIGGSARLDNGQSLEGKLKISGFGVPMVYRGDTVQVSAKLYPMRGSNQARMAYAQLKKTGQDSGWVHAFTRKFAAGMQSALPEPASSFALGLLIGQRSTLPQQIMDQLTLVGLVHIVAVSGYNLTILVRATSRLKIASKYQRLMISLGLILGFILITGFSASIVRAAIVSVLGLWAWYFGLRFRPAALIAFAAALTGLFNPFYVWSDLGWYLSFLAFFGVLVIAPIIAARLFARPPKLLKMVLIETLAAELMTLPLIMLTFGQLSLVSLLANLLIVPLVPLAMLLSAVAAAAGAWLPQLAGWFAWPANVLLTYMLDLVHVLSTAPMAMVRLSINAFMMVFLYGCLLLLVYTMQQKLRHKKTADWLQTS